VHIPPYYNSYSSYYSYGSYGRVSHIAPQSVSLCRGVNLLRPHPDGPHTLLLG
jgi:hypothetical protein